MVVSRGYPPLRLILYKKIVVTFHTSNINIVHILTRVRVMVTLMEVTHIVLVKSNIVSIMVNFTCMYEDWGNIYCLYRILTILIL